MLERPTILCVDDERINLESLRRTLWDDYYVLTALSGPEGIEILKKNDISLIISDQRMPQMTGVEFLENCIELCPDTVRIILTGFTEVEDMIGAINTGRVYRYITKPWDPNDLKITVKRALEAMDLTLENRRLFEDVIRLEKLATVGQVASGIGHEVRNQLSVLMGIQLIQSKYPDDELVEQVADHVLHARDRIINILDEIKALGKQSSETLNKENVSVQELFKQAVDIVTLAPDTKEVDFDIQAKDCPPIFCDKNRIFQVLINLMLNAVQAMGGEGTVVLVGELRNSEIQMHVKDSGCGISPENHEKIWQPFFTTKGEKGTGLGLQISKRIVQAHGGDLLCESEVGKGTTFTIALPKEA